MLNIYSIKWLTSWHIICSHIQNLNFEHPNIESGKTEVIKADTKNVEELERTVFIMKRVVEKVQAENKRLLNEKRPTTERVVSIHFLFSFLISKIPIFVIKFKQINLNFL